MARCATHSNARAAWICGSCDRTLCLDCAAAKPIQSGSVVICLRCGGFGRPITRPVRVAPFWEMFPAFLKAIFSPAGLIQLLAVALVLYLASWLPGIGRVLGLFVYISYFFRVIASAAQGGEKLPDPDDFLGIGSVVAPVLRFFVATTTIWLPALLYVLTFIGLRSLLEDPGALSSPVLVVLLLCGLCYFPAAIIAAAIAESVLAVINPMITIRMILRIPGQYALATFVCGALTVIDFLGVNAIAAALPSIPIAMPILIQMLGLVIPVFNGMILGRLIYQNHEHFGILPAGASEEPEWPEAKPRGKLDPSTKVGASEVRPLEIAFDSTPEVPAPGAVPAAEPASVVELDPEAFSSVDLPSTDLDPPAETFSAASGFELDADGNLVPTGDLPRVPAAELGAVPLPAEAVQLEVVSAPLAHIGKPAPVIGGEDEAPLRVALDRGDEATAYELFQAAASSGHYPALDARHNLRLAGVLERAQDFEEAVRACQRAAKADLKGPFAPKALFTAARIMSERTGQVDGARAMYQFLLKHFPQDALADRATDALKKLT